MFQVTRDVPGIDAAYLAMDTEDGVEVVWNEVRYSNRKSVASKVGGREGGKDGRVINVRTVHEQSCA